MYGWTGKILNVDLTRGKVWRSEAPEELLRAYLGGRGLGVRLMRDRYRLDPFDADMPLIFAVGPLCGTAAPATARLAVTARSPLTGMGGRFPWRLKAAGIDVLHISGESRNPVILRIRGEEAVLLPAGDLWGMTVSETARRLASQGSVAAIGPAGENGVLYASIMTGEGNAAGRGGLGAVMGKKKLKAVVADGGSVAAVADQDGFDRACRDIMRLLHASPVIFGEFGIARYGTAAFVDLMRERRMTPAWNFRETFFAGAATYSGPAIMSYSRTADDGCHGCPIGCRKSTPAGVLLPGYETLSHFGALNGIADLSSIIGAGSMCNDLGLDTISAAATIAAWGEWRGCFAETDEMPALLADIALRRGEGELLGLGSRRMMEELGEPDLSMSVKSMELPAYDPRGAYGTALGYCTGNRGGCHLGAFAVSHEILRKPVPTDRFSLSGKARILKIAEDANAAADSLVACRFTYLGASQEEYAGLLSAVTGIPCSAGDLNRIGERIFLTERFYNCANGFTSADDRLPGRFHHEPGSGGPEFDMPPIDLLRFMEELERYYRIRGLAPDGTFMDAGFLERQP